MVFVSVSSCPAVPPSQISADPRCHVTVSPRTGVTSRKNAVPLRSWLLGPGSVAEASAVALGRGVSSGFGIRVLEPVKHYIEGHLKIQHIDKESTCFDHYDPSALENIINLQLKLAQYKRSKVISKYIKC